MKIRQIPLLLCASLLFCACGSSDRIVFSGTIDAGDPKPLAATVLNDEFEFNAPNNLLILDSLLVVHDSYQQPQGFHVFRKADGAYLFSFGAKGRGPGEFLGVDSCEIGSDGRTIVVYDANSAKAIIYDIVGSLEAGVPRYSECSFRFTGQFNQRLIPYKDRYIVTGYMADFRFGIANPADETLCGVYADYLELSDDPEANRSLTAYSPAIKLSPDGKRLVAATYIGGVLEIFEVGDGGFKRVDVRYFFKPIFDYARGAKPRWVAPTKDTVFGFSNMCLTDRGIYGIVIEYGHTYENTHSMIYQFDYNGNPIACYTSESGLPYCLAVDGNGEVYAIEVTKDEKIILVRYDGKIDL